MLLLSLVYVIAGISSNVLCQLTTIEHMEPLKDTIKNRLIPSLTKHELNYLEMELVSLPARYGAMTFDDLVADSSRKHADSLKSTPICMLLLLNNSQKQLILIMQEARTAIRRNRRAMLISKADEIQSNVVQ